jgi:RNA polymerase sigma factor (sigma-70 family)
MQIGGARHYQGAMTPTSDHILRCVRSALGPAAESATDAALLTCFAEHRDQDAFELLVWRHAGLVLRVCRAVLRDHHAAEDAGQAVFLALARQAAGIAKRETVAGWLYRVARRIALRAARRRSALAIADLSGLPDRERSPEVDHDLITRLHREVDRLPEKYRVPIVLCFFEGLTHADAAQRLGWPVGTFATRIARAKARLQRRLARGAMIPAAGLTVFAAPNAAPAFVAATVPAAVAFAAGRAPLAIPPSVLNHAQGVIRTMTLFKLARVAGLFAACGLVIGGGAWAATMQEKPVAVDLHPAAATETPRAEPPPAAAPQLERNADSAQRRRSLNNLKQIMIALHNYHEANGHLPADIRDKDGKPLLSWRVAILPYIEQDALYRQFRLDQPWDSEHNIKLLGKMPPIYRVGFEPKDSSHTFYQVYSGPGAPFGAKEPVTLIHITDGTSNTLGVVEAGPAVPWSKPADLPYDPKKPLPKLEGPFGNAFHVSMLDGSATVLRRNVDPNALRILIGMNDGMIPPEMNKLTARPPAESAEERAALKEQITRNQKLIDESEQLLKEHLELLRKRVASSDGIAQSEDDAEYLKRMIDELKSMNQRMRGEPAKPGAPVKPTVLPSK